MDSGDALRDHLLASRLSGWVATSRSNSVDHFRRLADGDPYFQLGLDLGDRWPYDKIVTLMEERCGRPATARSPATPASTRCRPAPGSG